MCRDHAAASGSSDLPVCPHSIATGLFLSPLLAWAIIGASSLPSTASTLSIGSKSTEARTDQDSLHTSNQLHPMAGADLDQVLNTLGDRVGTAVLARPLSSRWDSHRLPT